MSRHWDRFSKYTNALFMLAPIMFAASSGSELMQRLGQIGFSFMAGALVIYSVAVGLKVSNQTKIVLGCLWIGALLSFAVNSGTVPAASAAESLTKLLLFSIAILAFDLQRAKELLDVLSDMVFPSAVLLAITLAYILSGPEWIYSRITFFGAHPNLGGEILLVAGLAFCTIQRMAPRLLCVSLVLVILFLLQSRAALIALTIIYLAAETRLHHRYRAQLERIVFLGCFLAGFAIFTLCVALSPNFSFGVVEFIRSDLLLIDDPYRGLGTGLVGRSESFEVFARILSEYPILGVGLDQANWTQPNPLHGRVHNGFLVVVAELGLFGTAVLVVLIVRLAMDARSSSFLFVTRALLLFVFFFSARSINLGVFPLIMWIAFLPWNVESQKSFARRNGLVVS